MGDLSPSFDRTQIPTYAEPPGRPELGAGQGSQQVPPIHGAQQQNI